MTFTVIARCRQTNTFGIGISTSAAAVTHRCAFVSRDGAIAFQAIAEPRLGALGLRLLEEGWSAEKVVAELNSADSWPSLRQIGVIDQDGRMAVFTGDENPNWAGHIVGDDYIVMGNLLAGPEVIESMALEFENSDGEELEERLLRAIEGGRDAGGEEEGQTSSGLITSGPRGLQRCDLRVDVHSEPIGELRRVFDWYKPLIPYYLERATNPKVLRSVDYLRINGIAREFGKPVPISRGPNATPTSAETTEKSTLKLEDLK